MKKAIEWWNNLLTNDKTLIVSKNSGLSLTEASKEINSVSNHNIHIAYKNYLASLEVNLTNY